MGLRRRRTHTHRRVPDEGRVDEPCGRERQVGVDDRDEVVALAVARAVVGAGEEEGGVLRVSEGRAAGGEALVGAHEHEVVGHVLARAAPLARVYHVGELSIIGGRKGGRGCVSECGQKKWEQRRRDVHARTLVTAVSASRTTSVLLAGHSG